MTGVRRTPVGARLSDRFDPRRNTFDVLRLVFAAGVATTHGMTIGARRQPYLGGNTDLGDLALDGFFVLSGFLVTRSYLRLDSPGRFAWHRFLRILPGFWVCLLVIAFVVAPLVALLRGLPLDTPYTVPPTAWRFVGTNAGLLMNQFDVSGLLAGSSPQEDLSFNGALWTLFFEVACYTGLLVAGVLGVLTRRRWAVLAVGVALFVIIGLGEIGVAVPINDRVVRLGFEFVLGSIAWLYADRIPTRPLLLAPAALVVVLSLHVLSDYRLVGGVPWAYLVLWVGTWERAAVSVRHDLSYGLYIYHFPTYHLLRLTPLAEVPTALFVVLGIVAALPVAAASWFLVERPALSFKDARPPWRARVSAGASPP